MKRRLCLACSLLAAFSYSCAPTETRPPAPEAPQARGPTVEVRAAPPLEFRGANSQGDRPGDTDCNSPAHWDGDTLYVFNSAGHPWRSSGSGLARLTESYMSVKFDNQVNGGRWFESTFKDDDGTLYGWYHHEPLGVCPETQPRRHLTAPKIGAARSADNGATWQDLGIILEGSPGAIFCDTENFYFAGGNGDFSVILDQGREYFYFFISTYGEIAEQGVSVARMEYAQRNSQQGNVWKWYEGRWNQPGIGGHVTPIFRVGVDWHRKDVDAFWGPSIHYNSHLGLHVILLNRAKDFNWTQEGIYITFNPNLADPGGWTPPRKILDREEVVPKLRDKSAWYPQVMGLDASRRETDKLAGEVARLFLRGESHWELVFPRPGG